MTTMRINGSERDVLRLFALDLPPDEAGTFVEGEGLREALGAEALRPDFVDVIRMDDLGEMPLSTYLQSAHGVTDEAISDTRAQVDGLTGVVLALPAQAFGGVSQTLTVKAPLRWVGTFGEERPETAAPALHSRAARGTPGGGKPSDAAMSGRIAAIALLVLFALVALMVWIAA
jgi:hypothetical protein